MGDAQPGVRVPSGRAFSAGEIEQIRATVAWLPQFARKELAATVCEHLQWHTVTGTAKVHACGQLLERLQAAGLVRLSGLRTSPARRAPSPVSPASPAWRETPVRGALSALGPVHLEVVQTPARVAQWKRAVACRRPLGERGGFGYRLRYFICAGERTLGCVLPAGAAPAVRDAWIGRDAPTRRANLVRVLNNSRCLTSRRYRFHIRPAMCSGNRRGGSPGIGRATGASPRCCWRPSSIRATTAAPAAAPPAGRYSGRPAGGVSRDRARPTAATRGWCWSAVAGRLARAVVRRAAAAIMSQALPTSQARRDQGGAPCQAHAGAGPSRATAPSRSGADADAGAARSLLGLRRHP